VVPGIGSPPLTERKPWRIAASETTERQQLVRFALRDGDPFTIVHLLETLDLRTRETADLLFAFEMLRSRNFPIDDLTLGVAVREPIFVVSSTMDSRDLRPRIKNRHDAFAS
jgi:hypothetical protein